jgi:hypothetical protein
MYSASDRGNALNLRDENHIPKTWRAAWQKSESGTEQTWHEVGLSRAAEVAIKLGGATTNMEWYNHKSVGMFAGLGGC